MKILGIGIVLLSAAALTGYLGFADVMANGFKALTLILAVLFVASWVFGGIKVSGPRKEAPRPGPRRRRTANQTGS